MNDSIEGGKHPFLEKGVRGGRRRGGKSAGSKKYRVTTKKVAIDEIKNGTRMVYDSRIDELCDEGTSCGFQIKKRRRREKMSISTR